MLRAEEVVEGLDLGVSRIIQKRFSKSDIAVLLRAEEVVEGLDLGVTRMKRK